MLRKSLLLCLVFILSISIFAQVPDAFKYQAVIQNSSGEILQNQDVSIQISILDGSATGTNVFTESHSVTTSNSGLINLNIGKGTFESGDFSTINWASGDKYLKVEIDETGGTTYTDLGAVELLSIPYALYANDVANKDDADADSTNEIQDIDLSGTNLSITGGSTVDLSDLQDGVDDADADPLNEIQNLLITGDTLEISDGNKIVLPYDSSNWVIQGNTMYYNGGNVGIGSSAPLSNLEVKSNIAGSDALFQVINANNDTVFAVYPDGVKIFIDPDAKGRVGGFAISGRSPSKAGEVEYMRVTTDSTRIYVNEPIDGKGSVGGFAISGRSPSKGIVNDYLVVTGDSTRIYVNDSLTVKGRVGGFAISGRSPSKGTVNDYLQVTRDSTRIFVTESTTKGSVGGFAISGRSPSKGTEKDYFNISGNLDAQTINPSEARIFWYPKKEAFLTGRVLVESPDSVGTNSMSTGFESKAIGDYSQALGYNTIARGKYSIAIGNNSLANNENTFAFGNLARANANDAVALGSGAEATGIQSFAIGSVGIDSSGNITGNTIASGKYSFALGMGSQAIDSGAFAIGFCDTASAPYSLAMGYKSAAKNWYATAMGRETEASGKYSTAMGSGTTASGNWSTAMGWDATASGTISTALGSHTIAQGSGSTAMGYRTEAYENYSTAMGYSTKARGGYSTTMGFYTEAYGSSSTAMGYKTIARGDYTTAIGREIEALGTYTVAIALNDQNGRIISQPNTLAIMGGKVGIGITSPAGMLHVADNLIIDGKIGIGTTNPELSKLRVIGAGSSHAIYTTNTDAIGTNYGVYATAGSTGSNAATTIKSIVFRSGMGTYYSGYFYDVGGGGSYGGLYADYRTGGAIDLAEYIYDTYNNLEKADVVVIDANNDESVVHNSEPYSANVAGIVSTQPHLVMGMELIKDEETGEYIPGINAVQLSLAGRVPVKVTDENGPIKRGDFITSSSIPGYAMKWTLLEVNEAKDFDGLKAILAENERRRNTIIGKALEEHTSGTGKIVVLISLQ